MDAIGSARSDPEYEPGWGSRYSAAELLQAETTAAAADTRAAAPPQGPPPKYSACPRDRERIRTVVNRECAFVVQTLRRFGVPEALADDASQMVFLTFSARVAQVHQESERAFLTGTCIRIAANVRRGLARCREVTGVFVEQQAPYDPEGLLQLKCRQQALGSALARLPEEQRSVFALFAMDGLSLPQIASRLAIPLGTATSRLRRARLRVEALLETPGLEQGGHR